MSLCPCGSNRDLDLCCGPILAGAAAPTPEAMMRSRYSAYVLCNTSHLENSLAPEARRDFDLKATESWAKAVEWQGLTILSTSGGGEGDMTGVVEFVANFAQDGVAQTHHEISQFRKLDGNWLYLSGDILRRPVTRIAPKVGRNEPCPCGSGKKFKQCCGR